MPTHFGRKKHPVSSCRTMHHDGTRCIIKVGHHDTYSSCTSSLIPIEVGPHQAAQLDKLAKEGNHGRGSPRKLGTSKWNFWGIERTTAVVLMVVHDKHGMTLCQNTCLAQKGGCKPVLRHQLGMKMLPLVQSHWQVTGTEEA